MSACQDVSRLWDVLRPLGAVLEFTGLLKFCPAHKLRDVLVSIGQKHPGLQRT